MDAQPKNSKTLQLNDYLKDECKKDKTYMVSGKIFQPLPKKYNTSYRGTIYGKTILLFLINVWLNGNIIFYQMSPKFCGSLLVMNRNNFKNAAVLLQSTL